MKRIMMLLVLLTGVSGMVKANDEIKGKVISVLDGNTLQVRATDAEVYKILLVGIDSPELEQEYGEKAKKFLERLVLNKDVIIQFHGKDRHGNRLAVVIIRKDVDLRVELLKEGLAWTAERDPMPELEPYRTFAQKKEKGLWSQKDPTPPWTYRRQQSMVKPKSM